MGRQTRIAITILKMQKTVVGLRLIKQLILKAVWYWQVDGHIDQWYRREKPERDSDAYTIYNWFFQKGKKQFMQGRRVYLPNGAKGIKKKVVALT